MSRVASLLKRASGAAVSGLVMLAAFGASNANADPCVDGCRGDHNSCRMTTKLLSSPRCDAQLQSCITRCFRRSGPSSRREPMGREPMGHEPQGHQPSGRDRGRH